MFLNLDNTFSPFGDKNNIQFESFTFSGGEPHIRILTDLSTVKEVKISHRIQSFNDLGILFLAVDALRSLAVEKIHLFLPYFPAARQDRRMQIGEPLSVKVYANLINAQNFDSVTIFDPHSDVTSALIDRCKVIDNHLFIQKIIPKLPENLVLISPDSGALKKVYKLASYLKDFPVVECGKIRDVKTGKLSGFKVYTDDLQGKNCLIVDDICDGGRTFMGLAKVLKEKNANGLFLAVSHGIFSRGLEELDQYFDHIFCTDSFNNIEENQTVSQINLKELL